MVNKHTRLSNKSKPTSPSEKCHKRLAILRYDELEIAECIDEYSSSDLSNRSLKGAHKPWGSEIEAFTRPVKTDTSRTPSS